MQHAAKINKARLILTKSNYHREMRSKFTKSELRNLIVINLSLGVVKS